MVPNILIVDDMGANLKLLDDILKPEGYYIRPVPDGKMALEAAEINKPDLILLDIMMPGMDGFEVCRRLKKNPGLADVPVIFISALGETSDIVKALTIGGVDYINKPFRAEEVKARVYTHLNLHRQSLELLELNKALQKQSLELQQQGKELHELNATKDKFFSIIAHDLRGPFNGFLGLTRVMVEDLSDLTQGEILKFAVSMRNSATNLFQLLENLLEWSRSQRGLVNFEPEPFLLRSMIVESMQTLMDTAHKKGVGISFEIPDDLEVYADKYMLASILRNLASNALKFSRKGGSVTIAAKPIPGNSVEISVRDQGIGMSSSMVDNLFRIDVQTNRKGTENEPSSGLGLLLCKDFIEKHGGKIWVESEEGKGSTLYFTLPIVGEMELKTTSQDIPSDLKNDKQ